MKAHSVFATFVLLLTLLAGTAYAQPETSSQPVNINTADVAALASLSGIGQSKAEAIVAYREQHGAFSSLEELARVRGIGSKTVAKNADRLTLQ
ncbi:ComEA family DNA-binding protein [Marinobacter sp. X15-166B]|uniref:ComEA family DNA-binding protein n=1 Tax=Marinobacter sp. X15-166B TaxID=1897620 RepID=UPI00085C914D|nr:ComEA family DNA-binding protein [Marinobacter sp. X15-166B]OEY65465.1 competence protein ComEA [Marinobacter sp. X15-166B]